MKVCAGIHHLALETITLTPLELIFVEKGKKVHEKLAVYSPLYKHITAKMQ